MTLKKILAVSITALSCSLAFAQQAQQASNTAPAAQPVGGASDAPAQAAAKPLSIRDLQDAFKKGGLPDEEVIRSMGMASPLTPDQIRAMRKYIDDVRWATSTPPSPPPKASVSSRQVSLEPGTQPSTVRLHNGIVSSLVFQDMTGAPWPVKSLFTGNKDWETSHAEGSNIIMISPTVEYSESNMSILLDGAPAPIILSLKAGKNSEADHRLDLVVQGRGPKAASISMDVGATAAIPEYLIAFQDGVPPADATPLKVRGVDGVQVWRHKQRLVVRTTMTLTAPESPKAIRSADGTYVYELEETPVAYFTFGGKRFRADFEI